MRTAGTQRQGGRPRGFTLLELLAGIVAASILVLTAGILLRFTYVSWHRMGDSVEMQRDEQIAMDMLTRLTRAGNSMTFTNSRYTIQRNGGPAAAIYAASSSLYYDPNTNTPNDQVRLVNGTLWGPQFSVSFSNNAVRNINTVTILLVQQANGDVMSNQVTVTRRN